MCFCFFFSFLLFFFCFLILIPTGNIFKFFFLVIHQHPNGKLIYILCKIQDFIAFFFHHFCLWQLANSFICFACCLINILLFFWYMFFILIMSNNNLLSYIIE